MVTHTYCHHNRPGWLLSRVANKGYHGSTGCLLYADTCLCFNVGVYVGVTSNESTVWRQINFVRLCFSMAVCALLVRLISFTTCVVHVRFFRYELNLRSNKPQPYQSLYEDFSIPFYIHPTEIYEFGCSLVDPDFYLTKFPIWKLMYAVKLRDCGFVAEVSSSCMRSLLKTIIKVLKSLLGIKDNGCIIAGTSVLWGDSWLRCFALWFLPWGVHSRLAKCCQPTAFSLRTGL